MRLLEQIMSIAIWISGGQSGRQGVKAAVGQVGGVILVTVIEEHETAVQAPHLRQKRFIFRPVG